ncbi:MAG: MXAN_5187 C-terminal domain-containing protein [Pseudomonadota bacterium]
MARLQRIDRGFASRLDSLELTIHQLKIVYEKYFNGIEKIEPVKEREDLRRTIREMDRERGTNLVQRHRYQTLRARFISLDQYIQRNLFLIERGTHPKFKFRANLADRSRQQAQQAPQAPQVSDFERRRVEEEATYRAVYDRYLEARRVCGQGDDLEFDRVRTAIHNQVRAIRSRFKCTSVKFKVVVEDGKARIKAVPQR